MRAWLFCWLLPVTDTRNGTIHLQSFEASQDRVYCIHQDGKEVMWLDTPYQQAQLALHGIEFYPCIMILICQRHTIAPVLILRVAVGTYNEPAHNPLREEFKAIDHFNLCLSRRGRYRPRREICGRFIRK